MSGSHSDSRQYERFRPHMAFWMAVPEETDNWRPLIIENISAGGLLGNVDHPLVLNTVVLVSFELPQHPDLIEAEAVCRHTETSNDGGFKVGLQFQKVNGLDIDVLMTYLEELFK